MDGDGAFAILIAWSRAMTSPRVARLYVLAAAVLFSTGGAAIKASAFTGWQVACFRSAVAAAAILLFVPPARRHWNLRVVLVGLVYASTMILFVLATKDTTAANAIFLQATAPLYLLSIGPWLLHEPLRPRDLVCAVVIAAGMALFFSGDQAPSHTAPNPLRGNILGAFSGLSWAATVAGLRWLSRKSGGGASGIATVAAGNTVAFLLCLGPAAPVAPVRSVDLAVILYLGVFQIGLAYVFLTAAVRQVQAVETSLLLLLEPVLNPVWAAILHGERPGMPAVLGGALVVLATLGSLVLGRTGQAPRNSAG